jgi:hypothetical protein
VAGYLVACLASCAASGFIAQDNGKGIFDAFKIKRQIKKKQLFADFRCKIIRSANIIVTRCVQKQQIEKQFCFWFKKTDCFEKQEQFKSYRRAGKISKKEQ